MVTIYDPVFADELMDRWEKDESAMLRLHAEGKLTPYICNKVEKDIKNGKITGFGTVIDLTCESYEPEEFDAWCECHFFDDDQNPPNIVCYQGHEVKIYELLHNAQEKEKMILEERDKYVALQEENERLKQELVQVRPPRTADATESAQQSHVRKWKVHAGTMVKVAYELGLSAAKGLTRAEIEAVCERHGGLPSTPYELLRAALPEGVVKKDPGPKVKS